jgi:anti-sigma factor RsiW
MRHASLEVLSSYLDEELTGDRRQRIDRHLRQCEECRHRLEGLHGVVRQLEGLARISPAPHLEQRVLRDAAASARRESLLDRLERAASRVHIERWVWLPTFGIVIALGSIIYLLSWGIERQTRGLPVILDAGSPPAEWSAEADLAVSESPPPVAEDVQSDSTPPVRRDAEAPEAVELRLATRSTEVEGRLFELRDGVWLEEGVDPGEAFESLEPAQAAASRWRERLPSLKALAELGGPVRVRAGDQLVQLEFGLR